MQLVKILLDLAPLLVFFWFYSTGDKSGDAFFTATAALMVTTVISIAATYAIFRKVGIMPFVTLVLVMVMGGLTIYLGDKTFIKMKPTVVYLLFAAVLGVGLYYEKTFLKYLFEEAFQLNNEGWRLMTWRWTFFFVFLAVLNELVWRNFDEEIWVKFKVFGFIPLTMAFGIAQIGLIQKYGTEAEEQDKTEP